MVIIACIDNNYGMLFNHRRQSRDHALIENILNSFGTQKIWMNSYSAGMFEGAGADCRRMIVDDEFLDMAGEDDLCFVENVSICPYETDIKQIILYKWNREYPADSWFPVDLTFWQQVGSEDFAGSSHEKITQEIYIK